MQEYLQWDCKTDNDCLVKSPLSKPFKYENVHIQRHIEIVSSLNGGRRQNGQIIKHSSKYHEVEHRKCWDENLNLVPKS